MSVVEIVGRALVAAFLIAGAAPIGSVLLLAIARLTGVDWSPLAGIARWTLWLAPLGALALLLGTAPPPWHLSVWQHPLFVGLRAGVAVATLGWAGSRLMRGASDTTAGVTLALYAALVTPIGADWLLAGEPGHGVSAIGMMLFVQEIAGACALFLVAGWGDERLRGDMARLLVAALLGLGYLAFMDYLIVWFGNLPAHVAFYVARTTWPLAILAIGALVIGLAGTIGALVLLPGEAGRRAGGVCALLGLALFDLWWLGGGVAVLVGAAAGLLAPVLIVHRLHGERAHG